LGIQADPLDPLEVFLKLISGFAIMNLVIINHYAGSPNHGMEFRPYYLAKEWKKIGHNVLIISASFSHLRSNQPEVKGKISLELIDGIKYVWIKVNTYHGNGLGRIQSMVRFVFGLFFFQRKIFHDFIPDVIIASSTYPMDIFPSYRFSKKYNARLCYEVHDLWPLSPMELGGYSKYHPFIMVMQWAEDYAYRNSDFVISILPNTLEHMIQHGLKPEKFKHIPNGLAIDEWDENQIPYEHIDLIESLKKNNKMIVGYIGGHAISNALDYLIEAANIASTKAKNLHFVLVGNGIEKPGLILKAKHLSNVTFLPPVPKKCVPKLLNSMDFLYLGWHHNPLYRFGISPNKLIDYMMAAKPIVHSVDAANDLVKEANCGISVSPENPIETIKAFQKLTEMDALERQQLGINGKVFVEKNLSYEKLASDFLILLEKNLFK
jgi:glycosyltransferase involved in cell wall biosynthesis